MGVLTDIVVADVSQAVDVGTAGNPRAAFRGVDAKGIDPIKLSTLYVLLTQTPTTSEFMGDHTVLYQHTDDGPWVFHIPHTLIEQLAELAPHQITSIAQRWATTEEFTGWSPKNVEYILHEIVQLARTAISEQKAVLMWMCL